MDSLFPHDFSFTAAISWQTCEPGILLNIFECFKPPANACSPMESQTNGVVSYLMIKDRLDLLHLWWRWMWFWVFLHRSTCLILWISHLIPTWFMSNECFTFSNFSSIIELYILRTLYPLNTFYIIFAALSNSVNANVVFFLFLWINCY